MASTFVHALVGRLTPREDVCARTTHVSGAWNIDGLDGRGIVMEYHVLE